MSRSGYTDDYADDDPLAEGRWRQAVKRAIEGARGQALLRELLEALDAMEDKRLYAGNFATAEGEYCVLGVLGAARGTKMDDLGDEDYCDPELVGQRFGIARALAAEIMYENDNCRDEERLVDVVVCGPMRPWERHVRREWVTNERAAECRFGRMRAWVEGNIKP